MSSYLQTDSKNAKLDTYRIVTSTFEPEKYITCLNDRCHI